MKRQSEFNKTYNTARYFSENIHKNYNQSNHYSNLKIFSHNYASLSERKMTLPILTLQNIIEYSKENKQELWLVLQVISKAFNSIDPFFLNLALKQIHLSKNIRQSIMYLAKNRRTKISTEYGLTDTANLQRGVDQRDTISPILWCIYYDKYIKNIPRP